MVKTATVAAISTALAPGGIGVIRISGEDALAIGDRVFRSISGDTLTAVAGYTCRFGHVCNGAGDVLDECVATVFRAPHSFTGENVAEFSCHGGLFVLQSVLEAVLKAGAKPAGPGEFTRRAFLNGKMDLAEAESVMQLISAKGREAAKAARAGQDGTLSRKIRTIRDDLVDCAAHLAAWADYPDDDIPQVDETMLKTRFAAGKDALTALLKSFSGGKALREGVRTVIAGRPNAGKSTLMNLLAGEDRSIVTEIPGTTRDVVEETVIFAGVPLRVADTAGLRETADAVEKIGVKAAKARLASAELVFAVFDGSTPLGEDDFALTEAVGDAPCVAVLNKSDLPRTAGFSALSGQFAEVVELSAATGDGLPALEDAVRRVLNTAELDPAGGILFTERQRADVEEALKYLTEAETALLSGMTLDAVTVSLEASIAALMELTGERVSDAVVDSVFAQFCVGK